MGINKFVNSFINEEDQIFSKTLERDQLYIKKNIINEEKLSIENEKKNPWKTEYQNSLFFEPKNIKKKNLKELKFNNNNNKPKIIYNQTRSLDRITENQQRNLRMLYQFTTDSSNTESESEVEGRTLFRDDIFKPLTNNELQEQNNRFLQRKITKKLSDTGKKLFDSLNC